MDSTYRPQSPDLSYTPQSPDLSGLRPQSPDLSGLGVPGTTFSSSHYPPQGHDPAFHGAAYGYPLQPSSVGNGIDLQHSSAFNHFPHQQQPFQPTSAPQQQQQPAYYAPHHNNHPQFLQLQQQQQQQQQHPHSIHPVMPPYDQHPQRQYYEQEYPTGHPDADFNPALPNKRARKIKSEFPSYPPGHGAPFANTHTAPAPPPPIVTQDPTLGCHLRTSFPVARIKRIMQADEDIGKVAQVTPTVVSRALELFMIKLISASAHQARGSHSHNGGGSGGGGGGGAGESKDSSKSGPRRVLAQHLKKAVLAEERFDFLQEIVDKVPDAPSSRSAGSGGAARKPSAAAAHASDSDDAGPGTKPAPRRKGRKRKDSSDDF